MESERKTLDDRAKMTDLERIWHDAVPRDLILQTHSKSGSPGENATAVGGRVPSRPQRDFLSEYPK